MRRPFWETTDALTDAEFRISFTMHRNYIKYLLDQVRPKLIRNSSVAPLRIEVVEQELRDAVILIMLAGESYLELKLLCQIATTTIYDVFENIAEVTLSELNFLGFQDIDLSQVFAS